MKEQRMEMSAGDWAMFEADLDLFLDKVIETADKHLMGEIEQKLKEVQRSASDPLISGKRKRRVK